MGQGIGTMTIKETYCIDIVRSDEWAGFDSSKEDSPISCISLNVLTEGHAENVDLAMMEMVDRIIALLKEKGIHEEYSLYIFYSGSRGEDNRITHYKKTWGTLSEKAKKTFASLPSNERMVKHRDGFIRYFALWEIDFSDLKSILKLRDSPFITFLAKHVKQKEGIFEGLAEAVRDDICNFNTERWETTVVEATKVGAIILRPSFFEELYSVGFDIFYNQNLCLPEPIKHNSNCKAI